METKTPRQIRPDFDLWLEWAKRHHVPKFYHFTDRRNLWQILNQGRLCARKFLPYFTEIEPSHRSIPASRRLDEEKLLDRFVFLSICKGTPMNHSVDWRFGEARSFMIEVDVNVLAWTGVEIALGIANNSASLLMKNTADLVDIELSDRRRIEVLVPGVIEKGSILNWKTLAAVARTI